MKPKFRVWDKEKQAMSTVASKKSNYSYKNIGNIYENPELLESVEE